MTTELKKKLMLRNDEKFDDYFTRVVAFQPITISKSANPTLAIIRLYVLRPLWRKYVVEEGLEELRGLAASPNT